MVSRYSKLPSPRACLLADWTAELVPPGTALAGLWSEWSGISALCSRMVLATVLAWGTSGRVTRPRRASGPDPASSPAPQSQAARGAPRRAGASGPGAPPRRRAPPLGPPPAGLASLPGHTCLVLARSAPFSLDSLASADPAPPSCLVASRVTRERPSTRPALWRAPGDAPGERQREVAGRDPRRLRVAAVPGQLAGEAGDLDTRAASILVSGPVTTPPHARRLSCRNKPTRMVAPLLGWRFHQDPQRAR